MHIFNFKTSKKNVREFQLKLAETLPAEFSVYKNIVREPTTYYSIVFSHKPERITIMYGYAKDFYNKYNAEQKRHFNVSGVFIKRKKNNEYVEIPLLFAHGNLQQIIVENPSKFHENYDFNSLELRNIKTEYIKVQNPDRNTTEKILKSLTKEQIKLLELEYTFEIELDEKLFYTILDMEDGNYVTVDKKGKVYRLNHDHEEQIKLIANKPVDFFEIYNGKKSELENIMNE